MKTWLALFRVQQYVKNLFVFFPLFFAGEILEVDLIQPTLLAFISFCLIASAVYIFNDSRDISQDREHPVKKLRPLASGEIAINKALQVACALVIAGMLLATQISWDVAQLLMAYLIINLAYSLYLKHIPIVDVSVVALGFWLRLLVGSVVSGVSLSLWIQLMTFLLALFIALAKRRDDVLLTEKDGLCTRKVVDGYNLEFVGLSMMLMGSVTIVCYIMYCLSPEVQTRVGSQNLVITVVFVVIGILRYMQLTFVESKSGAPVKILFTDRFLQSVILCWISCFIYFIYGN